MARHRAVGRGFETALLWGHLSPHGRWMGGLGKLNGDKRVRTLPLAFELWARDLPHLSSFILTKEP